jgi:signal transduction histidine kinase
VSQAHPQQVGLQVVNRALSRFAHVTGYVVLIGAILDVVGYQAVARGALIWPVLLPLAVSLALLVVLDRLRTFVVSVAFVTVAGITQYLLTFVMLSAFPGIATSHALVFSLVSIALILVCGSGFTASSIIVWGTVGFGVGQLASAAAALASRSVYRPDGLSIVVAVAFIVIEATDAITRSRRLTARPELDRAVIDDELQVLRYRIEVKAAALMHDTVLGHLAAIAAAADGPLDAQLASRIERDLAVLLGEGWLADPVPAADDRARRDWHRSALLTAVTEARELSLAVEVTGDLGAIGRLTRELDETVGLAVKQCLVNVLRHAQVSQAEVVVIGSEHDVSVMVIDTGRGFSEQLVGSDRLGLRQSVRRRIESVGGEVRLWSTPGRGTSILIQVPARPRSGSIDD